MPDDRMPGLWVWALARPLISVQLFTAVQGRCLLKVDSSPLCRLVRPQCVGLACVQLGSLKTEACPSVLRPPCLPTLNPEPTPPLIKAGVRDDVQNVVSRRDYWIG